MAQGTRATYIAANLINNRPEHESCEAFSRRVGLPFTATAENLMKRRDIMVGMLYRICKVFGYQVIVYNPKPPQGLKQMYVIGEGRMKILPREQKGVFRTVRDNYTGEIFRAARKYKRKKRKNFVRVNPCQKAE